MIRLELVGVWGAITAPKMMQKGTPTPIPIAAPVDRPLVSNVKTGLTGVFSDGGIEDKEDCRIDVSRVRVEVLVEAIEVAVAEFGPLGIAATPALSIG